MEKLTITRCTVSNGKVTVGSEKFEAQLNPSEYSHQHSISYTGAGESDKALGANAVETRFVSIGSEKISFDLIVDGTGVVKKEGGKVPNVQDEISSLKDIAYRYVGDKHEPSVVEVAWGDSKALPFVGRLESLGIDYTMFKPTGQPLRAKLKLSFISFTTEVEAAAKANRSSPDLSHRVQVRDGDTLSLLCQKIYNDSTRYLTVARANGLVDFRRLRPGMWLTFPKLDHYDG